MGSGSEEHEGYPWVVSVPNLPEAAENRSCRRPGQIPFPAGWYVYTGSARNGLAQRVGRHLRHNKRKHWHIDYLLAVADRVEAFVLHAPS